jgi:4-hydroxyisophthalate hydroxylase
LAGLIRQEAGNGMAGQQEFESDVVIVGGGPVGMGLAIELGQRGVDVTVIERYETPQQIPKGQNLTQRTMEHFHFWGAEKELRAARTIPPEYGIGGLTSYGTLLSGHHYDWLKRQLVRSFYYTENERLPQYETERVLRDRAAQLPSVRTLYGCEAEALEVDAAGVTANAATSSGATAAAPWHASRPGSRSNAPIMTG